VAGDSLLPDARRRFPRADLRVSAKLSLTGDPKRSFEATLPTTNISVGGIFFESTFFLKLGMRLDVVLTLPPHARMVEATGTVVRIESRQANGRGKSGFAVRFTSYKDASEVVLANFFLAPVLREFIQQYARKHRYEANPEYVAHVADLLAAWELKKAESEAPPVWGKTDGPMTPAKPARKR
jgi:hypothetical protein